MFNTLRALAAHGPVIVAVDDVQWLDPSSAAFTFAARRLGDLAVVFLLPTLTSVGARFRMVDVLTFAG